MSASAVNCCDAWLRRYVTNANRVPSADTCPTRATSSNVLAIPVRKERVAGERQLDLGEHELVGARQGSGIDVGAADDEDVSAPATSSSASSSDAARSAPSAASRIPRDDDVAPTGQRAEAIGKRVPRAPSHDDRVSHRQLRKCATSSGSRHGMPAVAADNAASRHRGDEGDRHTATGARIAGWCS